MTNRGLASGEKTLPHWVPPGVVWEYGGVNLPDPQLFGLWLWADGTLVSRSQYPDLWNAVQFQHSPTPGTDPGGGNFYLPNRTGKVGVGLDAGQTEFNAVGLTGGNKATTAPHTHDLAHGHGITNQTPNTNSTGYLSAGTGYVANPQGWQSMNANHSHGVRTTTLGGGSGDGLQGWAGSDTHNGVQTTDRTGEATFGGTVYGATINGSNSGYGDHQHGLENHNHDESHSHDMQSHTHANTVTSLGATASGASTAGATSGNLQPFVTMRYIVKA